MPNRHPPVCRVRTSAFLPLGLAALGFAACAQDADPSREPESVADVAAAQTALLVNPEMPSIVRDVAIHDASKPVMPTMPNLISSTNDGRIMIAGRRLSLNAPEKLTKHFWETGGGRPMTANSMVFNGPLHSEPGGLEGGSAICDGTRQFGITQTTKSQPYVCGGPTVCTNESCDCYDLTIITPVFSGGDMHFWGAPITVTVADPKTPAARIVKVEAQPGKPPVSGPPMGKLDSFFEPNVTGDGRLLIGRVGGQMRDEETKDMLNIVYAAREPGGGPCDVTAWTKLSAISRAPKDTRINQTYGFAKLPFRDAEGNAITPGMDIGATYPWIDHDGRNLFVKTGSRPLYYTNSGGAAASSYPARCVPGTTCTDGPNQSTALATGLSQEAGSSPNGVAVLGLWTRGRMVLLDGRVSNVDFGLGVDDEFHRLVKLYGPSDAPNGWIRVGTGRKNDELGDSGGNTGHIQSPEQLFNANPNLHPRTQRDVVWMLNTQLATEEIVFDDWVDPHALVVSDMMPSFYYGGGAGPKVYRDGFTPGAGFDGKTELRLQNAATATSDVLAVPSYGRVEGPARTEPVALGGIFGRGFWLTGTNRVVYTIPAQPRALDPVWYTALFVDARIPDDTIARRLLTFPDRSSVVIEGRTKIVIRATDESILAQFTLPPELAFDRGYRHLGLRRVGTRLEVLIDGFVFGSATVGAAMRFGAGDFVVGVRAGDTLKGVRGWLDELRVFNEEIGPELACNHARGSIIGLGATAPADLKALAALYPKASHTALTTQLGTQPTFGTYACRHDYAVDTTALSFESLPAGVTHLRTSILIPNAQLVFGQPRPDTTQNKFCLTCHVDGLAPELASLSLDALAPRVETMEFDRRRQPMQPPRRLFGWVPAGFVGPGAPATTMQNPTGVPLDRFVFAP